MACYSIVTLNTSVTASPEQVESAALRMGMKILSRTKLEVRFEGVTFNRAAEQAPWNVVTDSAFDTARFIQEVARAKILSEASRLRYRVAQDVRQGDKMVIRLRTY